MTTTLDIPRQSHSLHRLLELLRPLFPSTGTPGEASGLSDRPRAGREGVQPKDTRAPENYDPEEDVGTVFAKPASQHRPLDAEHLLQFAGRHRVLPQLYAALKRSDPNFLSPDQAELLRSYAQANTAKVLRLAGDLRRLIGEFDKTQIPVIPFKGIVLSALVYGDLSLRDVGDLDLLVRRSDIVRAADLLISLGHRTFFPTATPKETAYLESLTGARRSRYLLSHCEHHLVVDGTGLNVDLHWAMSLREFSVSLDVEGIWNRARRTRLMGSEMLALGDEDLLIVLCLNGAKDCWDRLDRVCDIARLLAKSADSLNWPCVFAHARQAGVARMLRVGLQLASTLLDAPLPHSAEVFVEDDPQVHRICRAITQSLMNPDPVEPSAAARAAFDLRLRERWSDRFAYCLRHLHPGVGDWAAVRLPDSLSFLHYVIRPFRLTFRHFLPGSKHA